MVGEADDVPSSIEAIKRLNPDVIFLDIQMPGDSGFELLERTDVEAHIIFVTAYDEYAIRAFEVNALDYLLKPVNPERLSMALEKLKSRELETWTKARALDYEDPLKMYRTVYTHLKYTKGFKVSQELVEDDQHNVIARMPKALAKSVVYTTEFHAANILNNAFDTSYTSYGDAKPLCSTAHPRADGGTAQSNASSTGVTLTEPNLETGRLALEKALNDPRKTVRREAALSLGKLGSLANIAIPSLIKSLEDKSPDVRWRASEALGFIGVNTEDVITGLNNLIHDECDYVCESAINAIDELTEE